jgi:alanyl-tRNA synthetase
VDTGMGLSVYAWLCNVTSNYDTDVFTPLKKSGTNYRIKIYSNGVKNMRRK